tara:strand:- start:1732 stop:1989 length:258 start_codon:yes stop_codon:yes gene_type:complete
MRLDYATQIENYIEGLEGKARSRCLILAAVIPLLLVAVVIPYAITGALFVTILFIAALGVLLLAGWHFGALIVGVFKLISKGNIK